MPHQSPKPNLLRLAILACVGSSLAMPALGQEILEEIIVTAQKRSESIQDVPIAVSAFSGGDLDKLQIDSGVDIQNYVPNMNYTGGGAYSIRGVGAAVGGTTGDVGVGIHINNVPVIRPRNSTAELYDVQRVEVLRGPQGTLYGRNATGGVVNFLTATPTQEFSGSVTAEVASYDSEKLTGHINVPVTDSLALRLAGAYLNRDGYTDNIATGNDIDGRDLWSTRFSMTYSPADWFESTLMWEHFEEDDTRNGGASVFCINDPGPAVVGSTPVTNDAARLYLSRGCAEGSIYDEAASANFNSVATFGGRYAYLLGLVPGDVFANSPSLSDPREVSYYLDPEYVVENDFVSWDTRFDLNEELSLNVLLGWAEDQQNTRTGSRESEIGFYPIPGLTPGGIFNDFQGGPGSGIRTLTMTDNHTEQFSSEIRLQSDFDGDVNFNLGAFHLNAERFKTLFISTNSTSLFAQASGLPLYFDENPDPSVSGYSGHQYFVSQTPYELDATALFGEVYWDINPELKLTAGLRYTDDEKQTDVVPILLFVVEGADGPGTPGHPATGPSSIQPQEVDFQEWTGRLVLDWSPDVSFTDETLVYASYSPGYKAGGFNSPDDPADSSSFTPYEPEFVKAFEVGTKNSFNNGRLQLNLAAFYYDYEDYQISFIEQFSARNTNVDAKVLGLELETLWEPVDNLVLTANVGWQDSEILSGNAIDPFDRLQGRTDLSYVVTPQTGCVVPTAALENLIGLINVGAVPASILANASPGPNNDICEGAYADSLGLVPTAGIQADVEGNELPNSPPLSVALGGSYTFALGSWDATVRADYSWKDDSYTSHFNGENYELRSWQNANLAFILDNIESGITVQAFAKNILNDDDTVVGYDLSGQGLGLARNATLLDPRIYGVNVGYRF